MATLVLASRNPTKLIALGRWVIGHQVIPMPDDLPIDRDEAGSTFAEIAIAKAEAVSRSLPGRLVVSTDGGLLAPGLGARWDPLRTQRFAGAEASPADRARALIRLAEGLRGPARIVGWQEALAVALDGVHLTSWVAESPPGELATTLHESLVGARDGFWVPAIWRCPECGGKRLADLTADERATRLDHWMQLGAVLGSWLTTRSSTDLPGGGTPSRG